MAVANNNLATILAVYAEQSIDQFIADIPILKNVTLDLSDQISSGGQTVTTRIPTTLFSTPGDLTNGWSNTPFTSSNVSITLKAGVYDHKFDELQWATMTPSTLGGLTFPGLSKQLANGICADVLNNVTSSVFTSTITINSASAFTVNTLATASNKLTTNEAPFEGRMAILTPNAYQALVANIPYAYQYGSAVPLQEYHGIRIAGFDPVIEYARLANVTPGPGGAKYTNNDKLVGVCAAKNALVLATRGLVDINYGSTWTGTAVKNGWSLQYRMVYDVSLPIWRVAAVTIYGSAAGNPNGIVEVLSQSTPV